MKRLILIVLFMWLVFMYSLFISSLFDLQRQLRDLRETVGALAQTYHEQQKELRILRQDMDLCEKLVLEDVKR